MGWGHWERVCPHLPEVGSDSQHATEALVSVRCQRVDIGEVKALRGVLDELLL